MSARRLIVAALSEDSLGGIATLADVVHAEQLADAYRTEVLREAKAEVVAWLAKKAHEGTEVVRLADKVQRGAIRLFLDVEEKTTPAGAPATPEFFRPGRTYLSPYSHLRVIAVDRYPATGERRVIAWFKPRDSGWWEIRDLNPDDHLHEPPVWTDVTDTIAKDVRL